VRRGQSFLQDRANDLLRGGERLTRMANVAGAAEVLTDADIDALRTLKLDLNDGLNELRRADRARQARPSDPLFAALERAAQELASRPQEYVDAFAAFLTTPLAEARDGIATALATLAAASWTGRLLQAYDARFETFDGVVLPLAYPDLGEANAVELWRVSPRDAPGAAPPGLADPVAKLAGLRLHHFGAFLDEGYRANDLLWGRLDGAEAIVRAVLPDPQHSGLRERFRIAAQAAILREAAPESIAAELRLEPGEANDARLVTAFLNAYEPLPDLDDAHREALAGRALAITGLVLAKDAKKHHVPKLPLMMLARSGPTIARAAGLRAKLRKLNPFS
jgi:hypothetical protein